MANPGFSAPAPRGWDHVGNLTPRVEYSESMRPHGEFKPADYLPTQRFEKRMEIYFVISAGKVVACDRDGRIVPAGLKEAFAATSGDVLTYGANDVTEKVVDLTTGSAVVAATGYTRAALTSALQTRGLLAAGENAEDYIGNSIGVLPYNAIKWAGGDGTNPAEQGQLNFNMQHQLAILCDYVIEMPLVPAQEANESLTTNTDWTKDGNKYEYDLKQAPAAKPTFLNPATFSATAVFQATKTSVANLNTEGDYFFDDANSTVTLYTSALDPSVNASTLGDVTYFNYASAPASVSTYACAKGDLKCGDFVKHDENSNYVKADLAVAGNSQAQIQATLDERDKIIGQVLEVKNFPKDFLGRVRTAYTQLGTLDRMPGSATEGLPDQVTYSGASNRTVTINLIKK